MEDKNLESHTRNQHYVPQMFLKNFSSRKSHIWLYDKEAKKNNWSVIKERPITKVASEDYFYDKVKNSRSDSYEYQLGKIEKEVAPIILKIIQTEDISSITKTEKETLSVFVAQQLLRTKFKLQYFKSESEKMLEIFKSFGAKDEDLNYKEIWFDMLDSAPRFSKSIFNKVWCIGKSNCESLFYSSDNPVVLQNSSVHSEHRGVLGLDSHGVEIYLPLNSKLILCFFCEKLLNNFSGKTPIIEYNFENILNVNALQVFQSSRYVFSSTNDFSMIDKDILIK